jgi:hypothetical protein
LNSCHIDHYRVLIATAGIGAFFLAREYVQRNRHQAMLARQAINYKLEDEIAKIRVVQEAQKRKFREKIEQKQERSQD